eukprot:scaffold210600_cov14-Tisochrysis_lutea.AAC.1
MSRSERGKLAGIPGLASKRKERGTTKSVCVPMTQRAFLIVAAIAVRLRHVTLLSVLHLY